MISRQWRGLARAADADRYVEYLRKETFPYLFTIPGFVGAQILRRALNRGVEFVIVTQWQSLEALQAFAGPTGEVAVVPQRVREMMLEYDDKVRLYEVVEAATTR
jgi:heme-degrading monooxygenase HmoA